LQGPVEMKRSERILRGREVEARTGLSNTTIWRKEGRGTFPKRIKLNEDGTAVGWLESEITAWIHARIRGGGRPVRRATAPVDPNSPVSHAPKPQPETTPGAVEATGGDLF
jgi:prophage regulatory protein